MHAQNIIISSIINIILGTYMTLDEHENLQHDNEWDIHMSSENYEESGYGLHVDLLMVLH